MNVEEPIVCPVCKKGIWVYSKTSDDVHCYSCAATWKSNPWGGVTNVKSYTQNVKEKFHQTFGKNAILDPTGFYSLGHYMYWSTGNKDKIVLDGEFTLEEIKLLTKIIENFDILEFEE